MQSASANLNTQKRLLHFTGLQAGGMDAGMAGNYVQLAIFIGICIGWVGTYLFRVATKASGGVRTRLR